MNLKDIPSLHSLSLIACAAYTASTNGSSVDLRGGPLGNFTGQMKIMLDSGAGTGTTPTLQVTLQDSPDNSTWTNVAYLPSVTGGSASFATNVMTCTVAPTAGAFAVGQTVNAPGVLPTTTIVSLGTGTGGLGTYNLSTSPGTIAAAPVTAGAAFAPLTTVASVQDIAFDANACNRYIRAVATIGGTTPSFPLSVRAVGACAVFP
jgi:hypothetical protein